MKALPKMVDPREQHDFAPKPTSNNQQSFPGEVCLYSLVTCVLLVSSSHSKCLAGVLDRTPCDMHIQHAHACRSDIRAIVST